MINPEIKNKGHEPPDGLPRYRLLTGKDDAKFCHRVSEALALGYQLYGSPAATFNGQDVIVAQVSYGLRCSRIRLRSNGVGSPRPESARRCSSPPVFVVR
ncbi:DUF1737 domain-containing protein [Kosakonia radicincitans]|uniref:DUF1737 domain-containing protein n=1 Tax=Kosakonia radicincitans TaxID=283686 RepID=UPI001EF9FBC7|nr:DUF1737 domain-containing protein [Kosakonia radicincitans]